MGDGPMEYMVCETYSPFDLGVLLNNMSQAGWSLWEVLNHSRVTATDPSLGTFTINGPNYMFHYVVIFCRSKENV